MDVLKEFPSGPLDVYRKKASFDWRKMKLLVVGEELVRFQNKVWKTLESDPLFSRDYCEEEMIPLQEYRRRTLQRMKRVKEYRFLGTEQSFDAFLQSALNLSIGMYDWSLGIKRAVGELLIFSAIRMFGTERHAEYLDKLIKWEIHCCFALTELSHGSNAKKIETKAVYDPATQEFVIHSPRIESAKCWVGNMGQCATHAILYAQLYTPDGECHGLHLFLVPIRDERTFLPHKGVTVGDLGPKVGLNGLDNGFLYFNNYRIPRENLLNKKSDVTVDGKYVTSVTDPRKRFGESVGSLSTGRVAITVISVSNMANAVTISIRYSATRRQFGPSDEEEVPVLEYQMQQCRLIPYIAATYVLSVYTKILFSDYIEFLINFTFNDKTPEMIDQAMEYHALSCAAKSLIGWTARDAIQESREACGGHGYLSAAGFRRLRNDNDANCTYEGDNNVILQQTSNYLLGIFKRFQEGVPDISHLKGLDFLNNRSSKESLLVQEVKDLLNMEVILQEISWVVQRLLEKSYKKYQSLLAKGSTEFEARSNSQTYCCRSLSISYIEHSILRTFNKFLHDVDDLQLRKVLENLGCLYGLWTLQKYIPDLYEGECCPKSFASLVKDAIIKLCFDLKDDAVALVDALAPPDFILNSVLGKSDGQLYKNLENEVLNAPGSQERPFWWEELAKKPNFHSLQCKI